MNSPRGQPFLVMKKGSSHTKGRDARRNNIMAARLIAEIVRTSLGPRGMDKMLIDSTGDIVVTNDGATMLKEMDAKHPAAKIMIEISKAVDNEVGDGTTSAVVLTSALLERAQELIGKGVHPTLIVDGYTMAADKTLQILNNAAIKIKPGDRDWLIKVANTSMMSKLVSEDSPLLSALAVDAALHVAEEKKDKNHKVDVEYIKIDKKPGSSLSDTQLIHGIVIQQGVAYPDMPKKIENAKIALINTPMEIKKTEMTAEIRITDPQKMMSFVNEEHRILKSMVDKVISTGANVVMCEKAIDDVAQHLLARAGLLAVRRIRGSDMVKLVKAVGGRTVAKIEDLTSADLGGAALVEERKYEDDKFIFVEGCKNPKSVTILIRGGNRRIVDEAERSFHDALMVVKDAIEKPAIVAGGGAPEAQASHQLFQWANTLSGREQLAVQKFAEGLEVIPLTLAENAGLDPLDVQVELRTQHSQGKVWHGVNVLEGGVADLGEMGIFEPLAVKEQIIKSATEAACMILRIDDILSAAKREPKSPPGGGPMGPAGTLSGQYPETKDRR